MIPRARDSCEGEDQHCNLFNAMQYRTLLVPVLCMHAMQL